MATIQSTGVGSGLDVGALLDQLMKVERAPLDLLDKKEASFKSQLSAYGTMKSTLSTLQSAAGSVASLSRLRAVRASVADTTLASASALPGAAAGSYSLEVQSLAQAHKLKSVNFAGTSSVVGVGTLTIEFGTYAAGAFTSNPEKAARTVTIGAGADSLSAVRDAINAADAGVSAGIVNDGAGERLVISSKDSGTANTLRITVDDDDGNDTDAAGLSRLAYDAATGGTMNLAQTAAAQDAQFVIDGIGVTRSSNTVTGAIEGVTLSLTKAAPGTTTTLSVARDIDAATATVNGFVKAYNDAAKALRDLSAYNADTKVGAVLQGDSTLIGVQSRMRSVLAAAVEHSGGYASLSEVGVSFQRDGTLITDPVKLRAALENTAKDAASAFGAVGAPSDSLVKYGSATKDALPGSYAIDITQIATRGAAVGSGAAALTITAGVNDSLQLTVNGTAATVALAAGTYTASSLTAMLQSRINGASALAAAGAQVEATESGGVLSLTSKQWGSGSSVAITGGTAMADLFGTPSTGTGVDAAGSIGGVAATASGRTLSAQGLSISVEGGVTGARGTLKFSRGAADKLSTLIGDLLDGSIAARTEGINASVKSIGLRREVLEARMVTIERRMRAQFIALDSMMSSMNSTSSFLSQQLANLPKSENTG